MDIETDPRSAVAQLYGPAHFFFFALVASWLSKLFSTASNNLGHRFILIILVIFSLGSTIEIIQPYFNRRANFLDLAINLLGGLFGLLFLAPGLEKQRGPVWRGAQAVILILVVLVFHRPVITLWDLWQANRQFPVLSDFETRFEANRWSQGVINEDLARHGHCSLFVVLGTQKYAGTTLKRSFGNWNGYAALAFSLYNPDDRPLRITVSIRDHEHFRRGGEYHDRYNQVFTMKQGWNDIAIPMVSIRSAPSDRQLELDRLSEMVIFTIDPPEPRAIYLDYVRLIR